MLAKIGKEIANLSTASAYTDQETMDIVQMVLCR